MRLDVAHLTEYAYSEPTAYAIQYVRLTPRDGEGQAVRHWSLSAPGSATRWRDGFGNVVHTVVQAKATARIALSVTGEIDTIDTHSVIPVGAGEISPHVYLRTTRLTERDERIADFCTPLAGKSKRGALPLLHAINGRIAETVALISGDAAAVSTAAEALEHGIGLCQDHAHLFIACCRGFAIPARCVAGYHIPQDGGGGQGITYHVWAEALVEDLGWVGFDPTTGNSPTLSYVRLAVGPDADAIAPVRGVRHGGGIEEMRVRLQAHQIQQAQQA